MTVKFKLGGTRHYKVYDETETMYLCSDINWVEKFLMEPVSSPSVRIFYYDPELPPLPKNFESITIKS